MPPMKDVHLSAAEHLWDIDQVGVKGLSLPIKVRDRASGVQHTVAQVDLFVDLPAEFKGAHMSRFVEALEHWSGELDYASFRSLLADVAQRLAARRAVVRFDFPYFLRQDSPVSKSRGIMGYRAILVGRFEDGKLEFTLTAEVPVMTVCPCSKAICEEGAHSQRAVVRLSTRFRGFVWLEDLIEIAERAGSSPVYSLLKREDEKFVTEAGFRNPAFVEDVVRAAAQGLSGHPQIDWFRVEVESFESIHNHSAFACIERTVQRA